MSGAAGLEEADNWYWASHGYEAWIPAYLSAFRDVLGLRLVEHEKFSFWEQAEIEGSFRVLHPDFCIVSDFPEILKIDDQNRPHCENGPSHRWRDGWSLYHWHGVKIPSEWIENKAELTAKTALTWKNIEQRRAACEILGWEKILQELGGRTIDTDPDPEIGELLEVTIPEIGKEKFLRVKCGTGRVFAIPVPNEMTTALDAQAWTWGLDKTTFTKPEVRT